MIAVISDVHGNLEALEAVIAEGTARGVEKWICLGDIVGYGANPNECIARVRELCDVIILGNHDEAAVLDEVPYAFNDLARDAALWTKEQLTDESAEYLRSLELMHIGDGATFVHASPCDPATWMYIFGRFDARGQVECFEGSVCFIGHVHVPDRFELPRDVKTTGRRWMVNAGSVGQPRDGNRDACLCLYDPTKAGRECPAEIVRVKYDVATARHKILDAGLPAPLALRLATGT